MFRYAGPPAATGDRTMDLGQIVCVALVAAAFAAAGAAPARAEDYPARPVTIVVPYAAGGTLDTVARYLGKDLSEHLGKTFLIENKAGGGTVIGANAVAKA